MTKKCFIFIFLLSTNLIFSQKEPCPRNQPVTAYHNEMNSIFLFGGYCGVEKTRLNDFWKFDGKEWKTIQTQNAPEARSGHSMIYDSLKNRLLVFGGKNNDGELLNDLWSWNGKKWKLLSSEGPTPRQSHKIVFNSDNGSVLLFGGSDKSRKSLQDTWVFNNEKWTNVTSNNSPRGRLQHTLAYDQKRKKVVLFGGFDRSENGKVIYGDTWEWDSSLLWQQKSNDGEMARDHHAMAYDKKLNKIILFGGYNQGYLGDTRSWDGVKWTLISNSGPARAGKPGMMYNKTDNCLILFGGGNQNNMRLMDFRKFDRTSNTWNPYGNN